MQLLQVAVQFSVLSMIRYNNLIFGIWDQSQLITFRVANCNAIGENSRAGYNISHTDKCGVQSNAILCSVLNWRAPSNYIFIRQQNNLFIVITSVHNAHLTRM